MIVLCPQALGTVGLPPEGLRLALVASPQILMLGLVPLVDAALQMDPEKITWLPRAAFQRLRVAQTMQSAGGLGPVADAALEEDKGTQEEEGKSLGPTGAITSTRAMVRPTYSLSSRIAPAINALAHIAASILAYAAVGGHLPSTAAALALPTAGTAAAAAGVGFFPPPPRDLLLLLLLTHAVGTSAFYAISACHELLHSRNPLHLAIAEVALIWMWWHVFLRQV